MKAPLLLAVALAVLGCRSDPPPTQPPPDVTSSASGAGGASVSTSAVASSSSAVTAASSSSSSSSSTTAASSSTGAGGCTPGDPTPACTTAGHCGSIDDGCGGHFWCGGTTYMIPQDVAPSCQAADPTNVIACGCPPQSQCTALGITSSACSGGPLFCCPGPAEPPMP